jgi:hypothetical protein
LAWPLLVDCHVPTMLNSQAFWSSWAMTAAYAGNRTMATENKNVDRFTGNLLGTIANRSYVLRLADL